MSLSKVSNALMFGKLSCFLVFLLAFFFFPLSARAITLDATTYTFDASGEIHVFCASGNPQSLGFSIYNLDLPASFASDVDTACLRETPPLDIGSFFLPQVPGNYVILEMTENPICEEPARTYAECKALPQFVSEFSFRIFPYSGGGGAAPEELPSQSSGRLSYRPEVEIISPKEGAIFSSEGLIVYKATDKNDETGGITKKELGLLELPVSIFYSDKIAEWDHTLTKDEDKVFIAKDLPAIGSFLWKIKELVEGKFYRIIVNAIDAVGDIGEAVSEFFNIDLTPPAFIVSADPPVAKNENVTITIESSEDLALVPEVFVSQRGAEAAKVEVVGSGRRFSGVYFVTKGFDGTASIRVLGTDFAGNKGNIIVGGGTFSVGVNPPGKPIVLSPSDNEKVLSETIDIKGTTREDTEIIVTVNGVDIYHGAADPKGEFLIKNVRLKKNIENGINIINVVAQDRADSLSEGAVIHVSFNVAPRVAIVSPKENATLTATTTISLQAADDNGDKIRFRYEMALQGISAPEEEDWQIISDTPSDKINFDTTEFGDGDYLLRATVDDGATETYSTAIKIRLKNELPFIRFDDGRRTVVSGKSVTVRGTVTAPENISPRPNITRIEYSTTDGKRWIAVPAEDGALSSPEERFAVLFQNLKEGVNEIIWRVTDSRGFVVKAKHPIIVDITPPEKPKILFPGEGALLTSANNEAAGKGKFEFTLRGTSEPGSTVNVEVDGLPAGQARKKFIGTAAFDGSFRITGVSLPTRGNFLVSAFATDQALNKSVIVERAVLYDNPPRLVFTSPRDGRGVGTRAVLSWLASDPDGDTVLNSALSYRPIGQPFIGLVKNPKENKFEWDTTKLPEGNNYELRLEANDGLATSTLRAPFSIDHSPPRLVEFNIQQSTYGKGGMFEGGGQATDSASGIEFIEYRFEPIDADSSKNSSPTPWYKGSISRGFLGKNASFSMKSKLSLPDGEYRVMARAVDAAGNVSSERFQIITVDATPPRVGSFEIASEGMKLLPKNGVWNAMAGVKLSLTLSLEHDTKEAFMRMNAMDERKTMLVKDIPTGLWKGEFFLGEAGTSTLAVSATDTLGNEISEQTLTTFRVAEKGKILYADENGLEKPLAGATVSASSLASPARKKNFWSFWRPEASGISAVSNENGEYTLLLPAGDWELAVEKEGFNTAEIDPVVFDSPAFITQDITLKNDGGEGGLWNWLFGWYK